MNKFFNLILIICFVLSGLNSFSQGCFLTYLPEAGSGNPAIQTCGTPPSGYVLAQNQSCANYIIGLDLYCINTAWDSVCEDAFNACIAESFCADPEACNYEPLNDGFINNEYCIYPGCIDEFACNYDPDTSCPDASTCDFSCAVWWVPNSQDISGSIILAPDYADIPNYIVTEYQCCASYAYSVDSGCSYSFNNTGCAETYFDCIDSFIGCGNPEACNYNEYIKCEDNSLCIFPICSDFNACNYDDSDDVCSNNDLCVYEDLWYIPEDYESQTNAPAILACQAPEGYFLADQCCIEIVISNDNYCITTDWDSSCNSAYNECLVDNYSECTDPYACNYQFSECFQNTDGCIYTEGLVLEGCTYPDACNYLYYATKDDGSCTYPGCLDPGAYNYDSSAGCQSEEFDCIYSGCTDASASNYEVIALITDPLSCIYLSGCTCQYASNFDPNAGLDDGSCVFSNNNLGDLNGDFLVSATDLTLFLSVFGINYGN